MKFIKERLGKWIQAAIIIVIGILCIVAGAKFSGNAWENMAAAEDVVNAISLTLGITMIVVGSLSLILAFFTIYLTKGKGFAAVALPGAGMLAVGVSLVVVKYAFTLISLLITVVPYVLIAVGVVIFLDTLFTLIRAIKAKQVKAVLISVICAFIVASGAIVIGALCIGEDPVIKANVQLIVFGIIVTLVGALEFLATFVKMPDAVIVVEKK